MTIIDHLESHLGELAEALKSDLPNTRLFVARFPNRPEDWVTTFATIGLSDHLLEVSEDPYHRQELVFAVDHSFDSRAVASFLLSFAEYVMKKHKALVMGDIVGPCEPIIEGVPMQALLAYPPTLSADSFARFEGTSPPTELVWLIPLRREEAEFGRDNGFRKLENQIETKGPDLFNLHRETIVRD